MFELVLQVLAYTGVGLAVLVVGFVVLDLLTPGRLATHGFAPTLHPPAWVAAGIQVSVALVVCASLT